MDNALRIHQEQISAKDTPRICEACGETKKLRDFPKCKGFVCTKCTKRHNAVRDKQEEKVAKGISELVSKLKSDHIDAPHISEFCETVVAQVGGIEIAAKHFVDCYNQAMRLKAGERLALDYHKALMKLVETSTEHRDSAPDIPSLSDTELTNEIVGMMAPTLLKVIAPDDWERAMKRLEHDAAEDADASA